MTANELADLLDFDAKTLNWKAFADAATMLRQQQAEIEALKQIIDANNLNQNIGQFVKAANEPVAWMDDLSFFTEQPDDMDGVTPLYTHPVKELTDAITLLEKYADKLEDERPNKGLSDVVLECVEILRKAQEK